jgi:hypothetical protein
LTIELTEALLQQFDGKKVMVHFNTFPFDFGFKFKLAFCHLFSVEKKMAKNMLFKLFCYILANILLKNMIFCNLFS